MAESTRHAESAIRPVKIAFVLGENPSNNEVLGVLRHCCETQGGPHSIIVPSNGAGFPDWWGRFITAFDPDWIVCRGKFKDIGQLLSQTQRLDIQPFGTEYSHRVFRTVDLRQSVLPADAIYDAKANHSVHARGYGRPKVVLAESSSRRTSLFAYFLFGSLSDRFRRAYSNKFDFIRPDKAEGLPSDVLANPIELATEDLGYMDYECFTQCCDGQSLGPYVVVTGSRDSLEDCCLFWNWRALTGRTNVEWVDPEDLPEYFKNIAKSAYTLPLSTRVLTSASLGPSQSRSASDVLSCIPNYAEASAKVGYAYRHPSEYEKDLPFAVYFSTKESVLLFDGRHGRIPRRLPPPYGPQDCGVTNLLADLRIRPAFAGDKTGVLLSPRHRFEDAFTVDDPDHEIKARINKDGFTVLLPWTMSAGSATVSLKTDSETISGILKRNGLHFSESSSGKHIRRSIELAGGIDELAGYYLDRVPRAMLSAFETPHSEVASNLRGRKRALYRRSYTVSALQDKVFELMQSNPGRRRQKRRVLTDVNLWISRWLEREIILSGFQLDCPECSFETWYPIAVVGEKYVCSRCLTRNRRNQSDVSYRLHESVYQAHTEHMIVPVLTLGMLKSAAEESFMYSVPLSDQDRPNGAEIDLVAIVDGELAIGECKTVNKLNDKVFERYGELAERIKAHDIVFSTTSREGSCSASDCDSCRREHGDWYSDQAFTHGTPSNMKNWGTREKIADFRSKMEPKGVRVISVCAFDLGYKV